MVYISNNDVRSTFFASINDEGSSVFVSTFVSMIIPAGLFI